MLIAARYATPAELAADVESQLGRGGLLVRGEVPRGLEQFADVQVEVSCGGDAILVAAQVLQLFPGVGVAVSIDAAGRARITELASAAVVDEPAPPEDAAPEEDDSEQGRRTAAGVARANLDKIQRALKGDREARFAIMRDTNRQLHMHVLRNPALALDEVAMMARMTGVAPEALKHIAQRREWGHRPEIAISLVRNPSLPVPIAIELVAHVSDADLKQLAKDTRTREPVQRAARRRLIK